MCIRGSYRKIVGIHRQLPRNRVGPVKREIYPRITTTEEQKGHDELSGCHNYKSRFIVQSNIICEPIFKMLRKDAETSWTEDCQKAFDKIKEYLSTPPVLIPSETGRPLLLYLSVLDGAFCCVLGQHDKTGRKEQDIYYLREDIAEAYDGWRMFFDGAANFKGVGVRAVLVSETSQHYPILAKLRFSCTNNMAEYEACIIGLNLAIDMNIQELLVEVASYKAVTNKVVVDFVRDRIVCRFGVPKSIITDNANLNSDLMKAMCETFKINHNNSTTYRPQMNGAVVTANKNIKKILRKMVENHKQWHEKLPFTLLGYLTTIRTFIGATPYQLVYGTEVVIPAEVEIPSLRIIQEVELSDAEWIRAAMSN
ncbi:uncharacterized protein [Nicotiana sylvestris]|uniref:uncharacterized protein n=1 Tax=Nicotiana sylvestris TaxID=4096 RepID=UPI00388C60CE